MNKVYIIVRDYRDAEGGYHTQVEEGRFFLSKEEAEARIEAILDEYRKDEDNWGYEPSLRWDVLVYEQ